MFLHSLQWIILFILIGKITTATVSVEIGVESSVDCTPFVSGGSGQTIQWRIQLQQSQLVATCTKESNIWKCTSRFPQENIYVSGSGDRNNSDDGSVKLYWTQSQTGVVKPTDIRCDVFDSSNVLLPNSGNIWNIQPFGQSDIVTPDVTLTSSPTSVYEGLTPRLTVNCSFSTHNGSDFTEVISLILSKANYNSQNYNELASITLHSNDQVHVKNTSLGANVSGHMDKNSGYLILEFDLPGDQDSGMYHCQAFGIEVNGHPRVSTASVEVIGEEINVMMCMSEFRNLSTAHQSLLADLTVKTEQISRLTNEINQCNEQTNEEIKNLTRQVTNLTQQNEDLIKRVHALYAHSSASYNGHMYLLTEPRERNITKSDLYCQTFGGYLVEIDNQPEYDFVYAFAMTQNKMDKLSIGATDENHEGTSTFVHSGKPALVVNKHDGDGGIAYNCLEIWIRRGMVDEPCYGRDTAGRTQTNILCEIPI